MNGVGLTQAPPGKIHRDWNYGKIRLTKCEIASMTASTTSEQADADIVVPFGLNLLESFSTTSRQPANTAFEGKGCEHKVKLFRLH